MAMMPTGDGSYVHLGIPAYRLIRKKLNCSGRILIYQDGVAVDYSEEEASRILSDPEVTVLVDMKCGQAEAAAWGCDLTYDYVKINADYRS